MEFPINVHTVKSGYFEGSNNIVSLSLQTVHSAAFHLGANSTFAVFHLGLHCLQNYLFPVYKGIKS